MGESLGSTIPNGSRRWLRMRLPLSFPSQITAPARVIATLIPKSVTPLANGAYIFDMGQNMVGWATLKVKGAAGTKSPNAIC